MHDDDPGGEPLDLSALDPMRDPAHWRAVVDAARARVDAALDEGARPDDPFQLIVSWQRPLLAAAAVVLLALIPMEVLLERREAEAERVRRLVAISQRSSAARQTTGADFRRALGGPTP